MKLFEFRLYKLKVIKDDEVIFEGLAEELPEDLKNTDASKITIENNEAVIIL